MEWTVCYSTSNFSSYFSCHILLPYLKTPSIGLSHSYSYTTTVQPNVCKLHSESLVTTILADMLHCLIEEASYTPLLHQATCICSTYSSKCWIHSIVLVLSLD